MTTLPLVFKDGHLFVELDGALWLFDSGAPTSFGTGASIELAGEQFRVAKSYFGLTEATLSRYVGVQCAGLLGADVLGHFDHLLDAAGGTLTISKAELQHGGQAVRLSEFMGIPILNAQIGGAEYRMFFDTGAQISYFQETLISQFPPAGSITDFYLGIGQFETETYQVQLTLSGIAFNVRCGTLPGLLGATLMLADAQGVIGNEILLNRTVGFFPRRCALYL
jgi:hypothetical protein